MKHCEKHTRMQKDLLKNSIHLLKDSEKYTSVFTFKILTEFYTHIATLF